MGRLLLQHGTLEKVIEDLGSDKVPANFRYQTARDFFKECEAVDTAKVEFEFKDPDIEGLTTFLVDQCSFSKERVERYIERLQKSKSRTKQRPLTSFFGAPKIDIKESDKFDPNKRKGAAGKAKAKAGDLKRKAGGAAGGGGKRPK